jgi:hypothetical protein
MQRECDTAQVRDNGNVFTVVVGNPDGKRPQGRPCCRWDINIHIYLKRTGLESVDGINLAQDRDKWQAVVNAVMNIQVLENARNFLTSCDNFSF